MPGTRLPTAPGGDSPSAVLALLRDLNRRAADGDASALAELGHVLTDSDVATWGDALAARTTLDLLTAFFPDDPAARTELARAVESMYRGLLGPRPTAVERLLARRVTTDWLLLHLRENLSPPPISVGRLTARQEQQSIDQTQKRIDQAHKRYVLSIKTLTDVKKMNLIQTLRFVGRPLAEAEAAEERAAKRVRRRRQPGRVTDDHADDPL